jgi:hypothetical protein
MRHVFQSPRPALGANDGGLCDSIIETWPFPTKTRYRHGATGEEFALPEFARDE